LGPDGKPSEAEVPLTSPPPLEYGVPMYKADGPITPPEGQRVESSRGYLAGSVGVAVVVGIDGVLGEDIRVLYPLIVLRTITFPAHHVPETTILNGRLDVPTK
jgi:hypothetical protein